MTQIKLKELSKLGFTDNQTRSLLVNTIAKHCKHTGRQELLEILSTLKARPEQYRRHEVWGKVAVALAPEEKEMSFKSFDLLTAAGQLHIFGAAGIERSAKTQMEVAMSLPVAIQGAMMPDAHTGYGLPIGAVLATENAVIPYAVGVDIGCRMALTITDAGAGFLKQYAHQAKMALKEHTHFGTEGHLEQKQEHAVLDDPRFGATGLLKNLHGKAAKQLGSSGSGNHFVEFGLVELYTQNSLALPAGEYLAILSHSGSRGLGAHIAMHYSKQAMDICRLPSEARSLAWLDMDSEAGQEYWLSMNLAGAYAKACHDRIHANLLRALGLQSLGCVENHHNFAWKEQVNGRECIVHRKGATPAHTGETGIIPGSMTTPAFLVRGKGNDRAVNSASHGAGRAMSRKKAKESMTVSAMKKMLSNAGVTLIGGSVEENTLAYKDIHKVMQAQQHLVETEGIFMPRIVRMNKE